MVALSIAPTRSSARAEEWIASNASLLELRLVVMPDLRRVSILYPLADPSACRRIGPGRPIDTCFYSVVS
jgi:hypothetical protein